MRWDRQTMSAANIGPTRCHSVSSTFHSASGAPRPGTLRVTCPHAQTSSPYRCFSCVTCSPNSPSAPTSTSSTYTPVRATKPAPVNASPHTSHWVGAWTCSPVRGNSTRRLCPGAPFWRPAGRFACGESCLSPDEWAASASSPAGSAGALGSASAPEDSPRSASGDSPEVPAQGGALLGGRELLWGV